MRRQAADVRSTRANEPTSPVRAPRASGPIGAPSCFCHAMRTGRARARDGLPRRSAALVRRAIRVASWRLRRLGLPVESRPHPVAEASLTSPQQPPCATERNTRCKATPCCSGRRRRCDKTAAVRGGRQAGRGSAFAPCAPRLTSNVCGRAPETTELLALATYKDARDSHASLHGLLLLGLSLQEGASARVQCWIRCREEAGHIRSARSLHSAW